MITLTHSLTTAVMVVLLAACSGRAASVPPAQPNPFATQPGDGSLMRGEIRVDSAGVRLAESNPPQVFVDLAYFQPTPCYKLRLEPHAPDAQNRILLDAYALAEKDKACTLMALATPLHASLGLGSYPTGHYTVWLNGSQIGEFDS